MPTLRGLRDQAADGYKNRYFARGVTTANGNLTLLNDADRQEPQGEWDRVDTFIQFQGGALDGVEKRVTGYSPGNSLTIAGAVGASIAAGMTYALYKTFAVRKWNAAINETLMDMAPDRMIQAVTTITEFVSSTGSGPSYIVNIPKIAVTDARIVKLERQRFDLTVWDYREIYEDLDYKFIHQDQGPAQTTDPELAIRLLYIPVDGRKINVWYEKRLASLTLDTDSTYEPLDQILYGARSHIAAMENDKVQQEYWAAKFQLAKAKFPIIDDARTTDRPRIIVR